MATNSGDTRVLEEYYKLDQNAVPPNHQFTAKKEGSRKMDTATRRVLTETILNAAYAAYKDGQMNSVRSRSLMVVTLISRVRLQVHTKAQERLFRSPMDLFLQKALEGKHEKNIVTVHRKFSSRPSKEATQILMDKSSHKFGPGFQLDW